MKYQVTIGGGGRTVEVEVNGERVLVDGRVHQVDLRPVPGTPVRNLLIDGRPHALVMEPAGRGKWMLQDQGERFEVEVLDERTRHIRTLVGEGRGRTSPAAIRAPMPGLVVRVLVEPGQQVGAGSGLVVLEAMKMENELKAASPGIVDSVAVTPGHTVERGAVLVTLRTA